MSKPISKLFFLIFILFFTFITSLNAQQVNRVFAPPGGGGSSSTSTTVSSSDNTLLYVAAGAVVVAAVVYAVIKRNKENKKPEPKDTTSAKVNSDLLGLESQINNSAQINLPIQIQVGLTQLSKVSEEKHYILGVRYNF